MTPKGAWLDRSIDWRKTKDVDAPWAAVIDGRHLVLQLGDFPAEPIYTLVVDGIPEMDVEDWPAAWTRVEASRRADAQIPEGVT